MDQVVTKDEKTEMVGSEDRTRGAQLDNANPGRPSLGLELRSPCSCVCVHDSMEKQEIVAGKESGAIDEQQTRPPPGWSKGER